MSFIATDGYLLHSVDFGAGPSTFVTQPAAPVDAIERWRTATTVQP